MSARLPPARIEDVVDGRRLRVNLTAAALEHLGDEDAQRKAALPLLHGALFRGRMIAKERLEAGAGGFETAQLLSAVADEVVRALYDFAAVHLFRARNPTQGERMAVVAVGGYGRGELAPSSDIDILFLRAYKPTPWAESVTEYMLYTLWDMALKVGHASRSIDECLRLAHEDHTIETALLEARHIAGDETLTADLKARFRAEVAIPGHRAFVAAKLNERERRRDRAGQSLYLVEPNVKESRGGLRDLHTLAWILKHRHGLERIEDFITVGALTADEARTLKRGAEFLWAVRCHLHFLTGRAEERLTFDVQPELAQRLQFHDRGEDPAVERFMKRYFLAARDIAGISQSLLARREPARPKPSMLEGLFARAARSPAPGFVEEGGILDIEGPGVFSADPIALLALFALAETRGLSIAPAAMAAARRNLRLITPELREDPTAIAQFLAVIESRRDPAGTLVLMNEAGVLGRFVPEFGRIVAKMQFNMYHHYTVDEHTLRAVGLISRIERGELAEDHPLSHAIFAKIINRRALYLAMLLHDTGKGSGDQQIEGEISARAACARLGLPAEEIDLIGWLVRHHLVMSDVAQKRDIADPATIASFAGLVGTLERLRLLLVLTVADIRAVGPGVWNGWKGQLLRDLYRVTEAVFHGGRTDEAAVRERLAAQAAETRAAVEAGLAPQERAEAAAFFDSLDDGYWVSHNALDIAWHLRQALAPLPPGVARIAARVQPGRGVCEVLALAPDRAGLFADLAQTFAAVGADVRDVRAFTTRAGIGFDLFSLQSAAGEPYGAEDPDQLARLLARLEDAAAGKPPPLGPGRPPPRREAAFRIEPWARVDNDLSAAATVIEVSGRDRAGVLAAIARTLTQAGLSIASAHVDSFGARLADVFYVTTLDGQKLTDPSRIAALQAQLVALLSEGEPDAPVTLAREPMATAPASDAR